ncbi:predicted protein [Naegleria gruberi]|uniref:Predicted protein n=1 Tax=Naegleria gruberi TaxID=5762 RepID=D2W3K8_NAEGR|nr:uncharacterized protein NAEGRDRAFT_75978 [Naegleria gruberi]EFC36328.1 predicted protein [Naegleria gruberi]|eukprot:XP_002669072.1 predicted protein [Naegleria gruberi strain NEG-M]
MNTTITSSTGSSSKSKTRGRIQKKAPRRQKTFSLFSNHNIQSTSFKVLQSTENSMMGVFKKTRSMCSLASYESVWNMNNTMIQNSMPQQPCVHSNCPPIIVTLTSSPSNNHTQQQSPTNTTPCTASRKKRVMSSSSLSSMCDSSSSENTIIAAPINIIPSMQGCHPILPHSQSSPQQVNISSLNITPIMQPSIVEMTTESLSPSSPGQYFKKGRIQMPTLRELLN